MRIVFCNITPMKRYEGKTDDDQIVKGAGSWVAENSDGHEKWNFLNYDGYCYGFVQNSGSFHLENLEGGSKSMDSLSKCLVVWCSPVDEKKTVIVGWYEDATLYHDYQRSVSTGCTGIDRWYCTRAKAGDCYLLPEKLRSFTIERAAISGSGKGFGQHNTWYARSEYAMEKVVPEVVKYICSHRTDRINRTEQYFAPPSSLPSLTSTEQNTCRKHFRNGDYDLFLPLGYRRFEHEKSADNAFEVSMALMNLHQFHASLDWMNRVVTLEGKGWETCYWLMYLHQQLEEYEEVLRLADELLSYQEMQTQEGRSEVWSVIADTHFFMGDRDEAISWLNKVIDITTDNRRKRELKELRMEWRDGEPLPIL